MKDLYFDNGNLPPGFHQENGFEEFSLGGITKSYNAHLRRKREQEIKDAIFEEACEKWEKDNPNWRNETKRY